MKNKLTNKEKKRIILSCNEEIDAAKIVISANRKKKIPAGRAGGWVRIQKAIIAEIGK